jgi:UDP-N-acetylglucosamine:LPS N-acetylglucosamine transferase
LLPQSEFTVENLTKLFRDLTAQPQELLAWARNAHALAKSDAAECVAEICLQAFTTHAEVAHV